MSGIDAKNKKDIGNIGLDRLMIYTWEVVAARIRAGDILMFMTGEEEIENACAAIRHERKKCRKISKKI